MKLLALLLLVGAAAAVPGGKIVGGHECIPHSRPWMASLNSGYHFCGAVLINEQWVLTVANCGHKSYSVQIMLGDHNLRVSEGTEQLIRIENIILHPRQATPPDFGMSFETPEQSMNGFQLYLIKPKYHGLSPPLCSYDEQTMDYDIMLIKLFQPVNINDYVKPLPLPAKCPNAGTPCSVSGWGVDIMGEEVNQSILLQCLNVPILENEKCQKIYPTIITPRMMCAGYLDGGRDVCIGDSGSGLECLGELQGLVSMGRECGTPGSPGVYVKVCEFLPWISETIKANM
uniref:Peptidase S1 domain-containing protein n=1 Tax=Esox lucius TaxID=8010 RepID=A0A3P8YX46_ESOLU